MPRTDDTGPAGPRRQGRRRRGDAVARSDPRRPAADAARCLAVLLVDTVGSTQLRNRLGQDAFDELMADEYQMLRRCVRLGGGSGEQSLGDGLMAWFPSATAALDAAQRMHAAAAELAVRAPVDGLALRVAVALSDVRIVDGEMRGFAPVLAARLEKHVPAGATYCTEAVRLAATGRGGYRFEPLGEVTLKDVVEPQSVHAVDWAERDEALERPPPARDPVPVDVDIHRPTDLEVLFAPLVLAPAPPSPDGGWRPHGSQVDELWGDADG